MTDILPALTGSLERAPWGWVMMLAVVGALIKIWPVIQLQVMNANATLRGEKRDDLHDCNQRLDELRSDVDLMKTTHTVEILAMGEKVHQLDLKLVGTMTAYRILHADISMHRPDSGALVQAQAIMSHTWNDLPMSQAANI